LREPIRVSRSSFSSSTRFQERIRAYAQPIGGSEASTTSRSASDDIDAAAAHLEANGVTMLSDELDYISRKLRFFEGPEGITLELVQWVESGHS